MSDTFFKYHPIVNFTYFVFVFTFTMFFMHPIALIISLLSGLMYLIFLSGFRTFKTFFIFVLPTMIITALINPLFNNQGVTILAYLPSGNPLTLESIAYGLSASIMLASIFIWFSNFNHVMTSDKFVYLFKRVIPSLSLVLTMSLRFVPKFKNQLKVIIDGQKAIGKDISSGSIINRAKNGLVILSIMITWALENSIETADSKKSRGHGLKNRTAFLIYKFDDRDKKVLLTIILLSTYISIGAFRGALRWQYFPSIEKFNVNLYSISLFFAYFILCIIPIILNRLEQRQWQALK